MAIKTGFKWPMVMTLAAWEACVAWDDGNKPQDETERLRHVLKKCFYKIFREKPEDNITKFVVDGIRRSGKSETTQELWVKAHPGDNGEPVLTIGMPFLWED